MRHPLDVLCVWTVGPRWTGYGPQWLAFCRHVARHHHGWLRHFGAHAGEPGTAEAVRDPEKARATRARYESSEAGQATRARYEASGRGHAADDRYRASDRGQWVRTRYRASTAGMLADLRNAHDRRMREL